MDEVEASITIASLRTSISPPPSRLRKSKPLQRRRRSINQDENQSTPTLADVEAGKAQISDHLTRFSTGLSLYVKPLSSTPRLPIPSFVELYKRNANPRGHHFVIHQHDHPIAGPHYDLRLQISETSSVSWAIMYGLPGNPNSRRLNRNATETRVHCLWNHLIETASVTTGSLLIWDTGEYSILPFHPLSTSVDTTDDDSDDGDNDYTNKNIISSPSTSPHWSTMTESQRLHHSFHNRRIRLRLHGTRLPTDYTISLRLSAHENRHEQPARPVRKRRRKAGISASAPLQPRSQRGGRERETPPPSSSSTFPTPDPLVQASYSRSNPTNFDISSQPNCTPQATENFKSLGTTTTKALPESATQREIEQRVDDEDDDDNNHNEEEEEKVRRTNAYPGAENSIGSVHQRRWFLSMDRAASGFEARVDGGRKVWKRRRRRVQQRSRTSNNGNSSSWAGHGNGGRGIAGIGTGDGIGQVARYDNHDFEKDDDDNDEEVEDVDFEDEEEEEGSFTVLGPAVERSVITGRVAEEVMRDEGVEEGWVGRRGWRAVV